MNPGILDPLDPFFTLKKAPALRAEAQENQQLDDHNLAMACSICTPQTSPGPSSSFQLGKTTEL